MLESLGKFLLKVFEEQDQGKEKLALSKPYSNSSSVDLQAPEMKYGSTTFLVVFSKQLASLPKETIKPKKLTAFYNRQSYSNSKTVLLDLRFRREKA